MRLSGTVVGADAAVPFIGELVVFCLFAAVAFVPSGTHP
jgi:hypothetical protein